MLGSRGCAVGKIIDVSHPSSHLPPVPAVWENRETPGTLPHLGRIESTICVFKDVSFNIHDKGDIYGRYLICVDDGFIQPDMHRTGQLRKEIMCAASAHAISISQLRDAAPHAMRNNVALSTSQALQKTRVFIPNEHLAHALFLPQYARRRMLVNKRRRR